MAKKQKEKGSSDQDNQRGGKKISVGKKSQKMKAAQDISETRMKAGWWFMAIALGTYAYVTHSITLISFNGVYSVSFEWSDCLISYE